MDSANSFDLSGRIDHRDRASLAPLAVKTFKPGELRRFSAEIQETKPVLCTPTSGRNASVGELYNTFLVITDVPIVNDPWQGKGKMRAALVLCDEGIGWVRYDTAIEHDRGLAMRESKEYINSLSIVSKLIR